MLCGSFGTVLDVAIAVLLEKLVETSDDVTYRFGFDHPLVGRIRMRKATGEVEVLEAGDGVAASNRAARVLRMCRDRNEWPDFTDYRA